jgi:hypothetical protein
MLDDTPELGWVGAGLSVESLRRQHPAKTVLGAFRLVLTRTVAAMAERNKSPTDGSRHVALLLAALLAMVTAFLLVLLHVLTPQFDPSWRMVSEYANGPFSWVLAAFFLCWALSTWSLAYACVPMADNWLTKVAVALLIIAGVGEAMAAVFDINRPLHMLAAILGMNGLPIAAILLGYGLSRSGRWGDQRTLMLALSWLPLLSVLVMAGAMAHFFSALSASGVAPPPDGKPISELPPSVVAYSGWANRLLITVFCGWAIVVALRLRAHSAQATIRSGPTCC